MAPPKTRFAQSGEASIAYQILGQGPLDMVMVPGFEFGEQGEFSLKGIPGQWRLYSVQR